jgi:hypothetical protein
MNGVYTGHTLGMCCIGSIGSIGLFKRAQRTNYRVYIANNKRYSIYKLLIGKDLGHIACPILHQYCTNRQGYMTLMEHETHIVIVINVVKILEPPISRDISAR